MLKTTSIRPLEGALGGENKSWIHRKESQNINRLGPIKGRFAAILVRPIEQE